ncbi:hypothetical protein CBM2634_U130008 [Cupriavidus taiwanensis]|uniref:Uncharacterized protein n=1 Tax=Cupriavidus taiwanensis TaxID=164546 RepID=A0A375JBP2_9BURK|nr:hypothetical protein CBM2634_U130008 [Cupriavidus taiwanensis]
MAHYPGQTCPELDAFLFFDADEILGAYVLAKKARPKGHRSHSIR